MKGTILSYRRGKHTQNTNQVLVKPDGVDDKEGAEKLVGKELAWETPGGKKIKGKVIAVHGGKGVVRAKFETNLPGQSFRTEVEFL
jgi:large subunit ribosomal protein L35Ae